MVIAHRISTIKNVDQVFVIDDGRIVESGDYGTLKDKNESLLRRMIDYQAV